ncbi:MAG: hypothetical protein A3F11_03205 [Gammaproteobacteria bacterium RIFCSPHIGHO2_12_FULL_37_14]|nr:MAG: hypothetical protein A3F11_03205 [Gammaproteobacteria bacterium RIFCSPHIGHO2_12_FULL_37_14]
MRSLIVGYGSIGKRHAQVLSSLGCHVSLVTSQKTSDYRGYATIEAALAQEPIDYVIISNPTYLHHASLVELIQCGYSGIVFIEKPLYAKLELLPDHRIQKILIGYNLRFCDQLLDIKKSLQDEELISFSTQVGQYLPDWRNTDYRQCYSAKNKHGGGVLRDLSHELDYSLWICGRGLEVTAIGGQYSELEIDADDVYSVMMRCEKCPVVSLQLNYLNRIPRREILIQTKKHTVGLDLIKGISIVDGAIKSHAPDSLVKTYVAQHQAVITSDFSNFCHYEQGLAIMKLIEAIEHANLSKSWVSL